MLRGDRRRRLSDATTRLITKLKEEQLLRLKRIRVARDGFGKHVLGIKEFLLVVQKRDDDFRGVHKGLAHMVIVAIRPKETPAHGVPASFIKRRAVTVAIHICTECWCSDT